MGLPRRPSPTFLVLGVLACATADRFHPHAASNGATTHMTALVTPRPRPTPAAAGLQRTTDLQANDELTSARYR